MLVSQLVGWLVGSLGRLVSWSVNRAVEDNKVHIILFKSNDILFILCSLLVLVLNSLLLIDRPPQRITVGLTNFSWFCKWQGKYR